MHKRMKKALCVLLAAVLLLTLLLSCVSVGALTGADCKNKLDAKLTSILEDMGGSDTVDVSVWLRDIDYADVAQEVKEILQEKADAGKISQNALLLPQDDLKTMQTSADGARAAAYSLDFAEQVPNALKNLDQTDTQEFIETKREISSTKYREQNTQILNGLFPTQKQIFFRSTVEPQPKILYTSKYAPNILMTLTKAQIYRIAQSGDVDEIYFLDNTVSTEECAEDDAVAAGEPIDTTYFDRTGITALRNMGYTGKNIKLGMIDGGVPNTDKGTKYYEVFKHMIDENNPTNNKIHIRDEDKNNKKDHPSYTACFMVGKTDTYTGATPDADLYCADGGNYISQT